MLVQRLFVKMLVQMLFVQMLVQRLFVSLDLVSKWIIHLLLSLCYFLNPAQLNL